MSSTQKCNTIIPLNSLNLIFNEVELDGTIPPNVGQTLVATSSTQANWQNQSLGAPVDATYLVVALSAELTQERLIDINDEFLVVDGGPQSNYQVSYRDQGSSVAGADLTTITINNRSNTAKNRLVEEQGSLVRSGVPYTYVRARTIINNTTAPTAGNTIDGVTLVDGDTYLNVHSTISNGIYQATSGSAIQLVDFSTTDVSGQYFYVREGTECANSVYLLSATTSTQPACIEDLARAINVNNLNDIPSTTISAQPSKFFFMTGTYTSTPTYTFGIDEIAWEGQGASETILNRVGAGNIIDIQANDISIKYLTFSGASNTDYAINVSAGAERVIIEDCIFLNRPAININGGCSKIIIKNCVFTPDNTITVPIIGLDPTSNIIQDVQIDNCSSLDTSNEDLILPSASTNTIYSVIITNCQLNNKLITDNTNSTHWIIKDNVISNDTGTTITLSGTSHKIGGNQLDGATTAQRAIDIDGYRCSITDNIMTNFANTGIRLNTNGYVNTLNNNLFDGSTTGINIPAITANQAFFNLAGNTINASSITINSANVQTSVQKNNYLVALTDPSSINGYYDKVLVNKTAVFTPTLSDITLASTNHTIYITASSDSSGGGSPIFNLAFTGIGGLTNIQFTNVGDYVWLRWENAEWQPLGTSGGIVIT